MTDAILDESGANLVVVAGALIEQQPVNALTAYAPGNIRLLIGAIRAKVLAEAAELDASTPKRRAALASLAAKVARTKTTLDALGKDLTEDWKKRAAVIDRERRQVRDELDDLKALVRQPVTDWEAAEEARIADHEAALNRLIEHPAWGPTETVSDIADRLKFLRNLPPRDWQEFSQRAARAIENEIRRAEEFHQAALKREAEAAELAGLRAEAAEREAQEQEVKRVAGHQTALKALREFEFFEQERPGSEAFARRIAVLEQPSTRDWQEFADEAQAARATVLDGLRAMHKRAVNWEEQQAAAAREEAAQQAKLEAERRAEEARVAAERRAQDEVEAAAQRQAAAEEAARQADLRAQEAARQAEARLQAERQEAAARFAQQLQEAQAKADQQVAEALERAKASEAERAANSLAAEQVRADEVPAARKAEVQREVTAALVTLGATDRTARTVWAALAAGRVPHVSVSYGGEP